MITLCLDTSHIFLTVALLNEEGVIDYAEEKCWKRQSEEIFPVMMGLMEKHSLQPEDIDAVVITEGPGSYTGVRIAMTIAKVFCTLKEVPLYTIGTLQLFAGMEHCRVILDARGGRVYTAVCNGGVYEEKPRVATLDEVKELQEDYKVVGDTHLLDQEDQYPEFAKTFFALKDQWVKAENASLVTPEYLKSSTSYLVK